MKVDIEHSEYTLFKEQWRKCRVTALGSEEIKKNSTEFLPKLEQQEDIQYNNYMNRALFFEATTRTITGLLGMMFAKEPAITQPDDSILNSLTPNHTGIKSFLKNCCNEIITIGKLGILVDVGGGGKAYLTSYTAENIINWRIATIEGETKLGMVVLREMFDEYEGFKTTQQTRWRVLMIDKEGNYKQEIYIKEEKTDKFILLGEPIYPTKGGEYLKEIPFYFISANGNKHETERPPLLGLVNVNLSHYMNSADLEHGRHFTGLPTPWAAGFSTTGEALTIGSQKAWVTTKTDAKAGYLEFTGQGLSTLENALKEKQDMMIVLGARLLEAPKLASESADNQETRKQGEHSILANIADSVSECVTTAVKFAVDWSNGTGDKYNIELNKEFTLFTTDAATMLALMQQVQAGLMSFHIYFYNMKKAGMYPDGMNEEEEQERIEMSSAETGTNAQIDLYEEGNDDETNPTT